MIRCKRKLLWFLLLTSGAWCLPAKAQGLVRDFPPAALRGVLQVLAPPSALLDGHPDRLSPGARIHGRTNMLLMTGAIAGERLLVNFTRDPMGLIHEVWVLTPAEAALARNLATPERNFTFESDGNSPRRDDGKTPYRLLPGFPKQ